jgi:hypothetical protein
MEGKYDVRPIGPRQRAVGARLALHRPTNL